MSSEIYPWDNLRKDRGIDPTLCFILSPFRKEFAGVRQVIEDVARELGMKSIRADDIKGPGIIHSDIWEHIKRASIIIADVTDSNPNVLFELGVATAIKEHFRVILMVRKDKADKIPFDLGPFRHIRYEDSVVGGRELNDQIREYFKLALSEDSMWESLTVRMEAWEKSERHYSLLPNDDAIGRLRGFSKIKEAPQQLLAYCLAGAIQHGINIVWWAKLNESNSNAAEVAVELILGPWVRPQFRAAFVLQNLSDELKQVGIEAVRRFSQIPLILKLIDAVQENRVVDFTLKEGSGIINESERYELLQNFTPHGRVRLFSPKI